MAVKRTTRLNQLLRRELGLAFEKYICPAAKGALVTVTGVEVTQELRDATVYVSVYGSPAQQEAVMDLVNRKRALLQSEISRNIVMRFTPVLKFRLDHTAEKAERVMSIISELGLDKEEGKRPATPEAPSEEGQA
ncbi:MAG: 30S ribosome-binding factor RbfA [Oligosphaeraceae bacterium]